MASIYKPTYVKVNKETGEKVKRKLRRWYIKYRDVDGTERRVKGFTDKEATRQRAAELERKVAQQASGMIDRCEENLQKALIEHAEDYRQFLLGKGNTEGHVRTTIRVILTVIEDCNLVRSTDLSGAKLQEWIRKQREAGLSPRTCNGYLIALKSFTKWLVKERRMREDLIAHLSMMNEKVDVRRKRRVLDYEELAKLIIAASEGDEFYRVSGPDRAMLYLVAAYTGLRAGELASLTPRSFVLESAAPTVIVEASYSKHRRQDVLPLKPDLAERLRGWLLGKSQEQPLWRTAALEKAALLVSHDLGVAGIPYRDDKGQVFDFHSLRHWFISSLAEGGCNPKALQTLARHSTVRLTLDKYAHSSDKNVTEALASLPTLRAMERQDSPRDGEHVPRHGEHAPGELRRQSEHVPQHAPSAVLFRHDLTHPDNESASQVVDLSTPETQLALSGKVIAASSRYLSARVQG